MASWDLVLGSQACLGPQSIRWRLARFNFVFGINIVAELLEFGVLLTDGWRVDLVIDRELG